MTKVRDQDHITVRFPFPMREKIAERAKANHRSSNAEIVAMVSGCLSQPATESADQVTDNLIYKAPQTEAMSRRVYVLPVELVQRIHAYGYENGHQSEVSAVRELLNAGLSARQNGENTHG